MYAVLSCKDFSLAERPPSRKKAKPSNVGRRASRDMRPLFQMEYYIDARDNPFSPYPTFKMVEHLNQGFWKWDEDVARIKEVVHSPRHKVITAHELRERCAKDAIGNANFIEFFILNKHLVPEEWRGKNIFFLGTLYVHIAEKGKYYVRYVHCDKYGNLTPQIMDTSSDVGENAYVFFYSL